VTDRRIPPCSAIARATVGSFAGRFRGPSRRCRGRRSKSRRPPIAIRSSLGSRPHRPSTVQNTVDPPDDRGTIARTSSGRSMPRAIDDSASASSRMTTSSSVIRSASNARFVSIAPITAPAIEARWRQARRVRSSNADGRRFAYAVSVPYRTPPAVSATPIADRNPRSRSRRRHDWSSVVCSRRSIEVVEDDRRAPPRRGFRRRTDISLQGNGRRLEELAVAADPRRRDDSFATVVRVTDPREPYFAGRLERVQGYDRFTEPSLDRLARVGRQYRLPASRTRSVRSTTASRRSRSCRDARGRRHARVTRGATVAASDTASIGSDSSPSERHRFSTGREDHGTVRDRDGENSLGPEPSTLEETRQVRPLVDCQSTGLLVIGCSVIVCPSNRSFVLENTGQRAPVGIDRWRLERALVATDALRRRDRRRTKAIVFGAIPDGYVSAGQFPDGSRGGVSNGRRRLGPAERDERVGSTAGRPLEPRLSRTTQSVRSGSESGATKTSTGGDASVSRTPEIGSIHRMTGDRARSRIVVARSSANTSSSSRPTSASASARSSSAGFSRTVVPSRTAIPSSRVDDGLEEFEAVFGHRGRGIGGCSRAWTETPSSPG